MKNTEGIRLPKKAIYWALLALMALMGVLLMLGDNGNEIKEDGGPAAFMEEKIKQLCESVEGVGDVKVAVTVESYLRSSAGTQYSSDVRGIGIVCRGGDDPSTAQKLLSLISAACDVPTNRIYITGGKKE